MSRLGRLFRWLLRQGAEAAVQELRENAANPGNKAKKGGNG